jgi:hypothetical protein
VNNDNIVILSMVGIGILVVADDLKKGGLKGTHLLALGVVYLILTGASDVAPKVAAPFALLTFTGVALYKGPDLLNSIGGIGSNAGATPAANNPNNPAPANSGGVVIAPKRRQRTT